MDLKLGENALSVLQARYLAQDAQNQILETPKQMFHRVAQTVAQAETDQGLVDYWTESFYQLMSRLDFLPNSPTLMNAGRRLGQMAACFVLPIEDSIDSIFETLKQAALIHKSGGGTGFDFSQLRPKGDMVKSTHGVSSGPVSFMRVFDLATETIKQGGARRGANMGLLRVDHPDIMDFIMAKSRPGLSNFNLSVVITDDFMEAVAVNGSWQLVNPHDHRPVQTLSAMEIFEALTHAAHATGEPGMIFIDQINRANPTPRLGRLEAVNPCGEQPLLPYESCNLGSINLVNMISNGTVDWDRLERVVGQAVRFLDDVISVNRYPLPHIEKLTSANRKIGLGVMGWADMLIGMELAYASEEALKMAGRVMSFIQAKARMTSQELARERGSFPNFKDSVWDGPYDGMRNATVTTIAPTGSLSIIAGVSSGIEPVYGLALRRRILQGEPFIEFHPALHSILKQHGLYDPGLIKRIVSEGRLGSLDEIPEELKDLLAVSHEIDWTWHVRTQAAFQQHTDNAVSKTINLPKQAKTEEVGKTIRQAHSLGLKGLTVYRNYSRINQVLDLGLTPLACPVCRPGKTNKHP